MKRNTGNSTAVILVIIGIIIVAGLMFFGKNNPDLGSSGSVSTATSSEPVLNVNGKTVHLIVVNTPESRELGLGNRESLPEDQAMLFVFDKPDKYEFWMKDMEFPIDMIWLDQNFKIVHIESDVAPETYPDQTFMPDKDALYVIEANSLFAQKNNLKIGDTLDVRLKK